MNKNIFLNEYNNIVNYNVGVLFTNDKLMFSILDICEKYDIHPSIKYVFGSQTTLLSGGRSIFYNNNNILYNETVFKNTVDNYLKRNIGICITYNNFLIKYNELNDSNSNEMLSYLNNNYCNHKNQIVVVSDLLKNYIREKYPNLNLVSSITKPAFEVGYGKDKDTYEYYNNLLKEYDYVVVNHSKIIEKDFWNKLSDIYRIVTIPNPGCILNCPYTVKHQFYESLRNKYLVLKSKKIEKYIKNIKINCPLIKKYKNSYIFSNEQIEYLIKTIGLKNLKLNNRFYPPRVMYKTLLKYIFNNNFDDAFKKEICFEC